MATSTIQQGRLITKRSAIPGTVPTVPAVDDIETFTPTDIFKGELFYNIPDNILYTRDNTGIVIVGGGSGPTYVYYTENTTPGSEEGKIEVTDGLSTGTNRVRPDNIFLEATDGTIISKVNLTDVGDAELLTTDGTGINGVIAQSGGGVISKAYNGSGNNSDINIQYGDILLKSINTIGEYSFIDIGTTNIHIEVVGTTLGCNIDLTGNAIQLNSDLLSTTALQAFADDTAAGIGGLTIGYMYQTDGTGAAPLNVPGIVMIKQ